MIPDRSHSDTVGRVASKVSVTSTFRNIVGQWTEPNNENGVSDTYIFDSSQKNWRNPWSILKISYTWNTTVSVELPSYISILILRIRNQVPSKRKMWPPHLPHSPPSEVEGVRIVAFSFWNIAKNCKIRKKSENIKTPYKNLEKYGSFSEFHTSTEKSVMLATLFPTCLWTVAEICL